MLVIKVWFFRVKWDQSFSYVVLAKAPKERDSHLRCRIGSFSFLDFLSIKDDAFSGLD